MKGQSNFLKIILWGLTIALVGYYFILPISIVAQFENLDVDELNQQIAEKRKKIEELEQQREVYQQKIEAEQKKALSLRSQISILENQIFQRQIKIQETRIKIEEASLQIGSISSQIGKKEEEISGYQEKIAEIIRFIYQKSQKNPLEIFLLNKSLADFFNQIRYAEDLQGDLQKTLSKLKVIKQGLQVQKSELETKKKELEEFKQEHEAEKASLADQQDYRENLLVETRGAERNFQAMVAKLQAESRNSEADIANLEKVVRDKLAKQKNWAGNANVVFDWPVPFKKITCYFHDKDYPFRKWIGEHSGVDLRADQGTPIRAPASGYVARAKDAGMGYSYIMLIHNDQLSTVYGHVSKIYVAEDTYVTKGQIIGLTGGMPGTRGAGSLSTGPHLHFEVRLNGIPVNPLEYLP